jgi:hypothetical protein
VYSRQPFQHFPCPVIPGLYLKKPHQHPLCGGEASFRDVNVGKGEKGVGIAWFIFENMQQLVGGEIIQSQGTVFTRNPEEV